MVSVSVNSHSSAGSASRWFADHRGRLGFIGARLRVFHTIGRPPQVEEQRDFWKSISETQSLTLANSYQLAQTGTCRSFTPQNPSNAGDGITCLTN